MSDMIERALAAMKESLAECFAEREEPTDDDLRAAARAVIVAIRDLPSEPGPRYTDGEYSRRTQEAMVDDALGLPR